MMFGLVIYLAGFITGVGVLLASALISYRKKMRQLRERIKQ